MKKTMRLAIASLLAIGLFVGCTGDAGTTAPAVVTTSGSVELNTSVTDTPIKVGDSGVAMTIAEGTTFTDTEGNALTKAPTAEVKAEKSETEAKTTIDFKVDGKRVIPTESVVMSVPAPAGAKAGDTVQIEVPDDGSIQKLIFVVVKADGTVDIRIFPAAFKKAIVIVVQVKVDASTN